MMHEDEMLAKANEDIRYIMSRPRFLVVNAAQSGLSTTDDVIGQR